MSAFIHCLLRAAEKSATIARTIREEKELFSLLVEEKIGDEKNKRLFRDFKTLADVLIQATVTHDVGKEFPEIATHIRGEESNSFTNTLGETVIIEVKSSVEETSKLLSAVLDGNECAAKLLAAAVHSQVEVNKDDTLLKLDCELPIESMGIWIDPIDSTAEYIDGKDDSLSESGVYSSGLQCVTVLLGAYDRSSGLPVVGVVNQPFHNLDKQSGKWRGFSVWGLSYEGKNTTSLSSVKCCPASISHQKKDGRKVVVLSTAESDNLKAALEQEWNVVYAAGAGYKQLCTALGLVDAYILSKGSTFKWDCCAPHALLRSVGGGIFSYEKSLTQGKFESRKAMQQFELTYEVPDNGHLRGVDKWSNSNGIIAVRNVSVLKTILSALRPETATAL